MDSGSTVIAVLLGGAVLVFLALQVADAALPLLRQSSVRESVGARGIREAALRRLRTSRDAYGDLVWLLTLLSGGGASALAVSLALRATDMRWPLVTLAVAGMWAVLLLLAPVVQYAVRALPVGKLVVCGVMVQFALWPLLPLRRLSRSGLWLTPQRDANGHPSDANGHGEGGEPQLQVEEEIADEPLEVHERATIHAILHLDETPVRELMVPRVDVVSLDITTPLDDAVQRILESGHSRLPMYEESKDNIVGILYSRDLLAAGARGAGGASSALRDLMRPAFFVPESKRVDEMLTEFQERRVHMAIVVDEYGGVAGIVTIEDLLEEIVGEIQDEFDTDEPVIERGPSGEAVVDARMPVDEFNAEFNADISPDGFDTLGGLLYARLGKIPAPGDVVNENGLRLQVITTTGRRVKRVRVVPEPQSVDAPESEGSTGKDA